MPEINNRVNALKFGKGGNFDAKEDEDFMELIRLLCCTPSNASHFHRLFEIIGHRYRHWREFVDNHNACFQVLMASFGDNCKNLTPEQFSQILKILDSIKFTFHLDQTHHNLLKNIISALKEYIATNYHSLFLPHDYKSNKLFPKFICETLYYLAKNKCEASDIMLCSELEPYLFSLLNTYVDYDDTDLSLNISDITMVLHCLSSMGYLKESLSAENILVVKRLSALALQRLQILMEQLRGEERQCLEHNAILLFYALCTMNLLDDAQFAQLADILANFRMRHLSDTQATMVCQATFLYLQANKHQDKNNVLGRLAQYISHAQSIYQKQARPSNPQLQLFDSLKAIARDYSGFNISMEHLVDWCVVDFYISIGEIKIVLEYDGGMHFNISGQHNVAAQRKTKYLENEGYLVLRIAHSDFDIPPDEKIKILENMLSPFLTSKKKARLTMF